MTDEISIGNRAIKEIQDLRAELVKLSEDALKAGKNMQTISTPSGLNKNGADNAKIGAELDALKIKYASLNETIVKKAEQSRLSEIRLQQQREKSFDSFEKNAKKEEALLNKNSGAYQRYQNSVNAMSKTYNDLAIRKELGNTLSAKEEKQLTSLSTRISTYQAALLKVDSQIGKNTRNVGNYASGYNALGNSINQLSREAPAFANSINTGFMALSNNFPALFDAINGIRDENKLLVAEGKPTTSLFKQLVAGIFSWQTLLSVGVTLLTIYGGKIVEWATGLTKAQKAQEALNQELINSKSIVSSESIQLQSLTAIVKDHNESSTNRKLAYDEIKKTLPGLTSATYKEAIATGELTRATDLYILSLIQKNIVEAEAKSISEQQTELNKENSKSYREYVGKVEAWLQSLQPSRQRKNIENSLKAQRKLEADNQQAIIDDRRKALVKAQEDYLKTQSKLKPFITDPDKTKGTIEKFNSEVLKVNEKFAKKELEALAESEHDKYRLLVKQSFDELDLAIKTDTEKIKQIKVSEEEKQLLLIVNAKNAIQARKSISDAMIAEEKKLFAKESAELKNLSKGTTGKVASIKDVDKSSSDALKAMEKQQQAIDKTKKSMEELHKSTTDWLDSFSSDFLQNSGFGSLETFFDGTFKKLLAGAETTQEKFAVTFNAIAESAQEVFNFISNASQANFDAEKERLQSQYDVSLKYAGDNKEAQTKLAEDLEAKKKEITNRENKAKQKQAIFNIAIDTAQAIIGLWANPGFPAAIPLTIAVGALGLAQIAMVSSQKVPQYFMGGTHDGGLMMVNDGAGSNYRETIVTPDGKIMQPTGRNVLMDAPAGTEIFTAPQWEQQLNDMLQGNGINWHNHQQSSGISKADLEDVMLRTIGNQANHHTNFDSNGVVDFIEKKGNITRQATKRGNGKGIKF